MHNKRAISKQNPFCSVRIAAQSDSTKPIIRGGQTPVWDHEVRFALKQQDSTNVLKLCVFDQVGTSAELIGDTVIQLKPAYSASIQEGYDAWHPIHLNSRYVGEVYLEMTYYPQRRQNSVRQRPSMPQPQARQLPFCESAGASVWATVGGRRKLPTPPGAEKDKERTDTEPAQRQHSSEGHKLPMPPIEQAQQSRSHPLPSAAAHLEVLHAAASKVPIVPPLLKIQEPVALDQEDISRQINDRYEASMFERIQPEGTEYVYS